MTLFNRHPRDDLLKDNFFPPEFFTVVIFACFRPLGFFNFVAGSMHA